MVFSIEYTGQAARKKLRFTEPVGKATRPEYSTSRWIRIDLEDAADRTFLTADQRLKAITHRITGIRTIPVNNGQPMGEEDYRALLETIEARRLTPWS